MFSPAKVRQGACKRSERDGRLDPCLGKFIKSPGARSAGEVHRQQDTRGLSTPYRQAPRFHTLTCEGVVSQADGSREAAAPLRAQAIFVLSGSWNGINRATSPPRITWRCGSVDA